MPPRYRRCPPLPRLCLKTIHKSTTKTVLPVPPTPLDPTKHPCYSCFVRTPSPLSQGGTKNPGKPRDPTPRTQRLSLSQRPRASPRLKPRVLAPHPGPRAPSLTSRRWKVHNTLTVHSTLKEHAVCADTARTASTPPALTLPARLKAATGLFGNPAHKSDSSAVYHDDSGGLCSLFRWFNLYGGLPDPFTYP